MKFTSFIGKIKLNFKDGNGSPKIHDGHYSIYHRRLQKKEKNYNTDYTMVYFESKDDEDFSFEIKEYGINKSKYKIHDSSYCDNNKDGN